MKWPIFLICLFLITPAAIAQQDWFYTSKEMVLDTTLSSDIQLVPTDINYHIDYVIANLSFFPRPSWRQEIISLTTDPEAAINENIIFNWPKPERDVSFKVNARVKTTNELYKVKEKIAFPINDLPEDIARYTRATKYIDSNNPDIIELASSLAEGEDDLYAVVYNLAHWVRYNVNYDLNSLTADISQPASWVLKNRQGVCDELTTLFIALNRAVGIPSRFIGGVAYTDWNNLNDFGAHAWAEVYFPGYGWVPFDVTYDEFGFIDASHIELRVSADSETTTTEYEWSARSADLNTKDFEIDTKVVKKSGQIEQLTSIEADVIFKDIGFGSFDIVEATIENINDYYVPTTVYMSETEGIEILNERAQAILLKPREKRTIYWIIQINSSLDKSYEYQFPIIVYTIRNASSTTKLAAIWSNQVYSREDVYGIANQIKEEAQKAYSMDVGLDCSLSKQEYYVYENDAVQCIIKNKGNVMLRDLKVCLYEDCQTFDLGISQQKEIGLPVNFSNIKIVKITANNNEVSKAAYLDVKIVDKSGVEIKNLEFPESVDYKEEYNVNFTLRKLSGEPLDLNIKFTSPHLSKEFKIEKLVNDERFVLRLKGSDLSLKENRFRIYVEYYDKNKNKYSTEEEFSISLKKVTFWQRIAIFFKSFAQP